MANSTGDPETGKDMEDLTEGLEELCESSKEWSEEVLLLSHLEQNHHLVSILRKKVDDTLMLQRPGAAQHGAGETEGRGCFEN